MTGEPRDETLPEGAWTFDESVAGVFDDMLARSIPQHDVMRATVTELALRFARPGTSIVDLGVSRGGALAPIVEGTRGSGIEYVGVDVSEPMLDAAAERFADEPDVRIGRHDLRYDGFPATRHPTSVALAVLTVQFVPIEYRLAVLAGTYRALAPGGALILVEKVLGATADLDRTFVDRYLDSKRRAGYSQEQIERKRLSLEGVLVPVTDRMNREFLAGAGFREIDCFWRWLNFAGWIAVR